MWNLARVSCVPHSVFCSPDTVGLASDAAGLYAYSFRDIDLVDRINASLNYASNITEKQIMEGDEEFYSLTMGTHYTPRLQEAIRTNQISVLQFNGIAIGYILTNSPATTYLLKILNKDGLNAYKIEDDTAEDGIQ
jgi:hypothetical protein